MLIGFSLSRCVADVIEGKVQESDVVCIISNTRIETLGDMRQVCQIYQKSYWTFNPLLGKQVAHHLWIAGKIVQPRAASTFNVHRVVPTWAYIPEGYSGRDPVFLDNGEIAKGFLAREARRLRIEDGEAA